MAASLLGSLTAAFHLGSAAASNSPDQLKTRGLRFGFVGVPRRRSGLQVKAYAGNSELQEKVKSSLVVCFGEMLIDFVPTTNGLSLAEAPAFKKAPGGAPANVVVGVSRLGGTSAFIGKVGEDEFGYMLANILRQNNVNSEGMRFDPCARTALAFVTLKKDGEREFMFYRSPSADMLLQESELDFDLIKKVRLHTHLLWGFKTPWNNISSLHIDQPQKLANIILVHQFCC